MVGDPTRMNDAVRALIGLMDPRQLLVLLGREEG
jgi:hypothetical protein